MANDLKKTIEIYVSIVGDVSGKLKGATQQLALFAKQIKRVEERAQAAKKALKGVTTEAEALGKISGIFQKVSVNVSKTAKSFDRVKAGINVVNGRLIKTSTTLARLSYALGVASSGLSQVNAKFNGVTRGLSAIKAGIVAITGFSTAFLTLFALKATITQLAEFDDALRAAGAAAGASNAEFEQLETTVRGLAATTKFTGTEVATAAQQLALAGFSVPETLIALPKVLELATAGLLDIGDAADIATNVLRGYGFQVKQLGRVNDVLVAGFTNSNTTLKQLGDAFGYVGPIAKAAGIEFEETAALLAALAQSGFRSTKAGVVLRNGIVRLLAPTRKAQEALNKLKLAVLDSSGAMRPMADILEDLGKSGANVTEIVKIFGRRAGPGMAALLNQGNDSLRRFVKIMRESGGVARSVAEYMQSGFGGSLRQLRSAWQELTITFGRTLEQNITGYIDSLTKTLRRNRTQIAAFGAKVVHVLELILDFGIYVGKLAAEFPKVARGLVELGLALPILFKLAGIIGQLKALKFAGTMKEFLALKYGPMVLGLEQIRAGLASMAVALKRFFVTLLGNPFGIFLLALTAVAAAFVALHEDQQAVIDDLLREEERLKAVGAEYTDRINKLQKIDAVFNTAKESSSEWADAEEELARLVPDTTKTIDAQGNIIARVGEKYQDNKNKLEAYLKEMRSERIIIFGRRLKALAEAAKLAGDLYSRAKKSIADEAELKRAGGAFANFLASFSTVGVGASLKQLDALRTKAAKTVKALDKLVFEAVKKGLPLKDFLNALDKAGAAPAIRDAVLESYKKYNGLQEIGIKLSNQAQADADAARNSQQLLAQAKFQESKVYIESTKAEREKLLRDVAILEAKSVINHEEAEKRKLDITLQYYADELSHAKAAYDEMEAAGLDTTAANTAVETARTKFSQAQLAALEKLTTEKRRILKKYADDELKLTVTEADKNIAAVNKIEATGSKEREKIRRSTTKKIEKIESALALKIVSINKKLADKLKKFDADRIEAKRSASSELAGIDESLADKLRAVRQRGMTDEQKDADNQNAANEKLKKGLELVASARAKGDKQALDRGKNLIQQAGSLFEGLKSASAAYSGLQRAAEAEKKAVKAALAIELDTIDAKEKAARDAASKEKAAAKALHDTKLAALKTETQIALDNSNKKLAVDLRNEQIRHLQVVKNLSAEIADYEKKLVDINAKVKKVLSYTPKNDLPSLATPKSTEDVEIQKAQAKTKTTQEYVNELKQAEKELNREKTAVEKSAIAWDKKAKSAASALEQYKKIGQDNVVGSAVSSNLSNISGEIGNVQREFSTMWATAEKDAAASLEDSKNRVKKIEDGTYNAVQSVRNLNGEWLQVHDSVRKIDGVWTNLWADAANDVSGVKAATSKVKSDLDGISKSEGFQKIRSDASKITEEVKLIDGVWTRTWSNVEKNAVSATTVMTAGINAVKRAYDAIKDKTVNITFKVKKVEENALGGLVGSYAQGGIVFHRLVDPFITRGSGTKDDVPAMLKRNEFVLRSEAVKQYGVDFLRSLNSGLINKKLLPQFNLGGLVASVRDGIPRMASGGTVSSPLSQLQNLGKVSLQVGQNAYPVAGHVDVIASLKTALLRENLLRSN